MSTELLSDREQEEALRAWWRENWPWVASGIAVGFVVLAGWNYWQRRADQQGEAAAKSYRELSQAVARTDNDKMEAAIKSLDAEHAGSPYADQAHLLLAQSHVNGGRFEMAATELKSVIAKSKDEALVRIAKLRLARVQIQLGHFDEALALLDVSQAGAFAAQVQEIRGDALLAKGDAVGARAAYEASILEGQKTESRGAQGGNEYLQLKLQELTAATPPEAPKAEGSKTEAPKVAPAAAAAPTK